MPNAATDANPSGLLPERTAQRSTSKDVMDFFPYKGVRPQQEKAIREALAAYEAGKRFVVLEGPCGSGKSAIIKTLADYYGTAHIITPLKVLQTQYITDFPGEIVDVRGKSNYVCAYDAAQKANQTTIDGKPHKARSCNRGPCTIKGFTKDKKLCEVEETIINNEVISFDDNTTVLPDGRIVRYSGCPYQVAKAIAKQAPFICHNFESFLYQNMNPNGGWQTRPFMAIDECHNIEGKMLAFMGVNIPQNALMDGDSLQECHSLSEFYNFFCIDKPYTFDQMMDYFGYEQRYFTKKGEPLTPYSMFTRARYLMARFQFWNDQDDGRLAHEANEIAERVLRLANNYEYARDKGRQCEYVFELREGRDYPTLSGQPLYAGLFSSHLFGHGERIMLASATILNPEIFCRAIGVSMDETEFVSLASDFPAETRPIKKVYAGRMSYAHKEATMPKLIDGIDKILSVHSTDKGLIHTHTFDITKKIITVLQAKYPDRLLTTELFKDEHGNRAKDAMLDFHEKSNIPTVILDPACDQGVDLPDDLCRFQILAKVPYPNMNKWMKAKMALPGGQEWYTMQAALKFVQSYGRGNRHKADQCVHYLLDADFDNFLNSCQRFDLLPRWLLDAFDKPKTVVLGRKR